jgi:hypothetical protein
MSACRNTDAVCGHAGSIWHAVEFRPVRRVSLRFDDWGDSRVASADIGEGCLGMRSPELMLCWHSRNFLASVEVSRRGSFGQRGEVGRAVVERSGFRMAAGERVSVWCLRDEILTQYLVA